MKITIINGTHRVGNKSLSITRVVQRIARDLRFETSVVTLVDFDDIDRERLRGHLEYTAIPTMKTLPLSGNILT